jgi:hypothetical protein
VTTASSKLTPRAQFLEDNLRAKEWHDFLIRINFTGYISESLWHTAPPTYIRTDNDRWEYLRQIAAGHLNIPGCGLVCRGELAQFLRENDPESPQ